MYKGWLTYREVALITLRERWAYVWDQALSTLYLALIMFVFVQLWKATYSSVGSERINGYTLPEMIWYLVMTEGIIFSLPRVHTKLETEVKNGDLAIRLNKPYHYLLFHYSAFLGEGFMGLLTALLAGGMMTYLLVGGFAFQWSALPILLLTYLLTNALHFCYNAALGLAAFWMEDVSGLYLLFERLKWMLGGLLLPVEVYPAAIRRVVEALPFRYMIADPARLIVKFRPGLAIELLLAQCGWLVVFGLFCWGLYRMGARRVDLNGG